MVSVWPLGHQSLSGWAIEHVLPEVPDWLLLKYNILELIKQLCVWVCVSFLESTVHCLLNVNHSPDTRWNLFHVTNLIKPYSVQESPDYTVVIAVVHWHFYIQQLKLT